MVKCHIAAIAHLLDPKLPNSSRILALRSQCDDPSEPQAPLSGAGDLSEHIHTHTIVYKYKLINFLSNLCHGDQLV